MKTKHPALRAFLSDRRAVAAAAFLCAEILLVLLLPWPWARTPT